MAGVWGDRAEEAAWSDALRRCRRRAPVGAAVGAADLPRIVHIVHQVWLGPAPIPARCLAAMRTWRALHGTWTYKLWRDADVASLAMAPPVRRAYALARNFGEKSDIARYAILQKHGGVYADVDVDCVAGFDGLHAFEAEVDFYCGESNTPAAVELGNSLIGARPGHPLLEQCLLRAASAPPPPPPLAAMAASGMPPALAAMLGGADAGALAAALRPAGGDVDGTIGRTGPGMFTRVVLGALADGGPGLHGVAVFPPATFYPVPNSVPLGEAEVADWATEETLAAHLWAKSWQ